MVRTIEIKYLEDNALLKGEGGLACAVLGLPTALNSYPEKPGVEKAY